MENLNTKFLLQRLDSMTVVLPALVQNLSDADMRWHPPSGNWSLLEIVCHLAEEEVNDFRARVKTILDDPNQPWPAIVPEKTVIEKQFNQQGVKESLEQFLAERKRSVEWLGETLGQTNDWESAYLHPEIGPIKAGDLLASWIAHDLLHVRQIAKRIYELNLRNATPYEVGYAGELT